KVVIGAAFYARTWENVENASNGLYQAGKFKSSVPYRVFGERLSTEQGYTFHLDTISKATHAYNPATKTFATFDDPGSVAEKTRYAKRRGLKGIMFWELTLDRPTDGLLDVIDRTKKEK
ncbi:MAG TPA: glycoside hydrolase family 18 protein, partial [Chitinophagaceae bacterium]|nr:glycoside hydrolase family 18 protein [Chitinophagaceae bacterium]